MRYVTVAALAMFLAVPAFAQRTIDVTGWAAWVDPNSEGTFATGTSNSPLDLDVNFDGRLGYGAAVNVFFTDHISTEFSAVWAKSESTLSARQRAVTVNPTDVDIIPITGTLQWHFAPNGRIDPYIGAGAAYVVFSDVSNDGLQGLSLNNLESGDLGLVINGGVGIGLSKSVAILLDAKYVPVGSSAKAELITGEQTDIDINPVIFSAGLSFRF